MKFDTRAPCSTCPYRKDVPVGTWHRSEFERLLKDDADPARGAVFGCHKGKSLTSARLQVCGGWLLDQKKRGVPSIGFRMDMIRNPAAGEAIDKITSGGHPVYSSIAAMCKANGVRVKPRRRMNTAAVIRAMLKGEKP